MKISKYSIHHQKQPNNSEIRGRRRKWRNEKKWPKYKPAAEWSEKRKPIILYINESDQYINETENKAEKRLEETEIASKKMANIESFEWKLYSKPIMKKTIKCNLKKIENMWNLNILKRET